MSDSKIKTPCASDSPPLSAHRLLSERLNSVQEAADRLVEATDSEDVPKAVHRLRVSTRRADTAVKLLGRGAKKAFIKRLRKRLRALRDAASSVRSCHVDRDLLMALRDEIPGDLSLAAEAAAMLCHVDALHEEDRAIRIVQRIANQKLPRAADRLLKSITRGNCDCQAPLARLQDTASELLPSMFEEMQERIDTESDWSNESLHALRLQGKKLRYALELFAPCRDASQVDAALDLLTQLQDALGALNDGRELSQRLRQYAERAAEGEMARLSPAFASLADFIDRRTAEKRSDFISKWEGGMCERLRSTLQHLRVPETSSMNTLKPDSTDGTNSEPVIVRASVSNMLAGSAQS